MVQLRAVPGDYFAARLGGSLDGTQLGICGLRTQMVFVVLRAHLVQSAREGYLPLFERLLLGGKAQVVGVDKTIGGKWEWLVVGV